MRWRAKDCRGACCASCRSAIAAGRSCSCRSSTRRPIPLPHPGSLFFRPSTTQAVLEDLGRSLAAQGFHDIIVSNFHGSPRHFLAIETACATVSRERNIRMVCIFSVLLSRLTGGSAELYEVLGIAARREQEDLVGDTHGGLVETSQLLALHPEWVERDYAALPRRTVDIWLAEQGEAPPQIERGKPAGILTMINAFQGGLRFFRAETYAGAPGSASPELGERILDTLAREGRRGGERDPRRRSAADAVALAAVDAALLVHEPDDGALLQPGARHPERHGLAASVVAALAAAPRHRSRGGLFR